MKRQTNLLPWGALILTLALLGGWLLNVSEVAAEPPDPFVVNATDDLATGLIIGFAPFFLALAGRGDWMPTWLARWGYLAGAIGLFSLITLYIPALTEMGMLIIPVGIGWMIAAGAVLLRR